MNVQNLETERKCIPNASQYEIDSCGFVYRKGLRLHLQRSCGRWNAQVYTDEGTPWRFDSERLARSLFQEPDPILTYDDVMNNFKTRPVPNFSRYVVTSYGAIYCINPPKRGPNAGSCYLVHETLKRGYAYVTLYNHEGDRRYIKVSNVVKSAWY